MIDNFAAFILTHGRPDKVKTYDTLIKQGYTGPIYIIIDNEDKTAHEYYKRFGDKVIMFDKADIANRFDTGDNFTERRSVFFARNACFEIAESLGIEYFLQLDDDYGGFLFTFTSNLKSHRRTIKRSLDDLFIVVLNYYKSIKSPTIALIQGGDLLGGRISSTINTIRIKRKAMNTFFCSTSRPFYFVGRVNEDVNTYATLGNRGELIFTIPNAGINQEETQSNDGGMSDLYYNEGTYRKSFYTVMYAPSFVKIYTMGRHNKRIHHKINWNNAVPCIVSEDLRKRSNTGKTPELLTNLTL